MKDQNDKATNDLYQPVKKGRGRPSTGKALTSAERQKQYRLRNKTKQPGQKTVTNITENETIISQRKVIKDQSQMIERLRQHITEQEQLLEREKNLHVLTFKTSESYKAQLYQAEQRIYQFELKAAKKRNVTKKKTA